MSQRLDELAMRRQALLQRSAQLRAEFVADQHQVLESLSGVDRFFSTAKRLAPAALAVAGGLLVFRFLRPRKRAVAAAASGAAAVARPGLVARALFWIGIARRVMPYIPLLKEMWLQRSSLRSGAPAFPRR